jgi:cephalosporin hydroxylase
MTELFNLSDTQLLMSFSYHPQTDGQTERLNRCLEAFVRGTVHAYPKQWKKWLPLAEYWYNTTFKSALGILHLKYYKDILQGSWVF